VHILLNSTIIKSKEKSDISGRNEIMSGGIENVQMIGDSEYYRKTYCTKERVLPHSS